MVRFILQINPWVEGGKRETYKSFDPVTKEQRRRKGSMKFLGILTLNRVADLPDARPAREELIYNQGSPRIVADSDLGEGVAWDNGAVRHARTQIRTGPGPHATPLSRRVGRSRGDKST